MDEDKLESSINSHDGVSGNTPRGGHWVRDCPYTADGAHDGRGVLAAKGWLLAGSV